MTDSVGYAVTLQSDRTGDKILGWGIFPTRSAASRWIRRQPADNYKVVSITNVFTDATIVPTGETKESVKTH